MSKVKKIELSFVCDEDWNKMTPVEAGRHCSSCQKTVVNFTGMSDAQLIAFYAQKENAKTCGQFRTGQLEYINKNLVLPKQKSKPSFYHSILATVLLSTAACSSQTNLRGEPEVKVDESANTDVQDTETKHTVEQQQTQTEVKDDFQPRKITYVDSLQTNDSVPEKHQDFKSVVVTERISHPVHIQYERHIGGVPMISYDDDVIKPIKGSPGIVLKKAPLHKRMGAKIRKVFSRKD